MTFTFSGELLLFLILALVSLIGGILLLQLKKVVHMVLALVMTFVSLAGVYVMLSAEFVAVVQILIYSGAVTIIMLFGIMLTRHLDEEQNDQDKGRKFLLFLGVMVFAVVVYYGIFRLEIPEQTANLHLENTKQIGIELFSKYVIPFELASVLLLVALVGAIVLAKKDDEKEEGSS
ncbi:NADH dehydrogenase subunit J [Bacillus oleivorans]|uniref:NADH-quinone oxidoreductase subunit J n=1 Tax=Bacillus oleivorans TaxID=1448271 RepID=A0A285CHC4_9BACI|nr:NADH-quinone oxidoreductase subunit J [Bacillus oleivorans]SNX66991.1 NADH dehydrogenase subunit J [Bacillus oleivorans]